MSDREKILVQAGQQLVAAFGHRVGCPVLNRPEWACGCGQADEHGYAMSAWRTAVETVTEQGYPPKW
jgi:hypothetical protein